MDILDQEVEVEDFVVNVIIKEIIEDCVPVDVEELTDDMLDDCYSFDNVGGYFSGMLPSRVLSEVDPIAYREAVADMYDSMSREDDYIEIDENLYCTSDVQDVIDRFIGDAEDQGKNIFKYQDEYFEFTGDELAECLYDLDLQDIDNFS